MKHDGRYKEGNADMRICLRRRYSCFRRKETRAINQWPCIIGSRKKDGLRRLLIAGESTDFNYQWKPDTTPVCAPPGSTSIPNRVTSEVENLPSMPMLKCSVTVQYTPPLNHHPRASSLSVSPSPLNSPQINENPPPIKLCTCLLYTSPSPRDRS